MTNLFIKHVALRIPTHDTEKAKKFYTDFGLNLTLETAEKIEFSCDGVPYPSIVLLKGNENKSLHHVEIGISSEKMRKIKENLNSFNVETIDSPLGFCHQGIWLYEPHGILFHIVEMQDGYKTKPVTPFLINAPGHQNRVNQSALPPKSTLPAVKPLRMGHVLLFTPDIDISLKFIEDILGMRLSDRSGKGVAFTHCAEGSEHHVIAFSKSSHIGFHHASFLVKSPDEVGIGGQRMIDKGHEKSWGFGRHAIGSNFFHYIADPWGSYVEYYSDMDFIFDSDQWEAKNWPVEDALYSWGPNPPHDFVHNYEPNN